MGESAQLFFHIVASAQMVNKIQPRYEEANLHGAEVAIQVICDAEPPALGFFQFFWEKE